MANYTVESTTQVVPKALHLLSFSWIDYTLFFMMFFVSAAIGVYFGCFGTKQNTTSEYLLGSRKMGVFPIAVSLVAGHLSGITLLGVPAEIYMYGGQYFACLITSILTALIITYVYLPPFYKLNVSSSYEYLKIRFDDRIRIIALALYIISSFFYIPIVIYIPALAFNQVSGIGIHYITPLICGVCIFYTTIGGLKAVVWTDTLQYIITLASLLTVFIIGIYGAGGFKTVMEIASQGDRLDFFHMDLDPTIRATFWGIVIGMTTNWVCVIGVAPSCVQRFMSVPSMSKAKQTVLIFGVGVLITKLLTCICGYIMYAKYHDCDPYTNKEIKRPDQILPYYVMDVARGIPGLPGLFVSGIFSTALSTMSAHLNTLAGVIYEDFLYKYMPAGSTDLAVNNVIKITVVVCGLISVGMVFIVERLGGIIQASNAFAGITSGPLLGLFTLGMVFPQATTKAALYGSVIAMVIMAWIVCGFQYNIMNKTLKYAYKPLSVAGCSKINETVFNDLTTIIIDNSTMPSFASDDFTTGYRFTATHPKEELPNYLFRISFYWFPIIGVSLVVIIGLFVTYISKEKNENRYNKDLYTPFVHRFVPKDPKGYKSVDQALTIHLNINEGFFGYKKDNFL